MELGQINLANHFIDFWVIFFADVFAAYCAIKFFESKKEMRGRTEHSLSKLYQLVNGLYGFYWKQRAKLTPHDQKADRISNDITDDLRGFRDLHDDLLFWSFPTSTVFKSKYEAILKQMDGCQGEQAAGELRAKAETLIKALEALRQDIVDELKPKTFKILFFTFGKK